MFLMFANSLLDGFLLSNGIGKGIVIAQLLGSVAMFATIIGKWRELKYVASASRRFLRDFSSGGNVLEYYFNRRPSATSGLERIYKDTCDRLLKLIAPEVRLLLGGKQPDHPGAASLTSREIELVRGTCENAMDEETIRVEGAMPIIATVVALSPMLGLLGTVWGVLDAFADMGSAGSANLATIAPSISSALVTTVVGLIIAIPGVCFFNALNTKIRDITSDIAGFADELMGRIACEFQENQERPA